MFLFSMENSDASIYTNKGLSKYGIIEDKNFERELWEKFFKDHPHYDPDNPESEGYEKAQELKDRKFFRMEWITPSNLKEAVHIIQDIFFFSPKRVWIAGKEYNISEYFDSIQ